jgi:uncharacterized protein (TIGR02611 family)
MSWRATVSQGSARIGFVNVPGVHAARAVVMQSVGWFVLVVGIIMIPAPGPGLLVTVLGLAILQRYNSWARRMMAPVKLRAVRGAAESVESTRALVVTTLSLLGLLAFAVVWILQPKVPGWWPVSDYLWFPGGWYPGIFVLLSAMIAALLMGYSIGKFRGEPEALARLEEEIHAADRDLHRLRDEITDEQG